MVIKNRSVPTNTVLPHLVYVDVAAALAWLSGTFGFEEHYRYGEPDGAQMRLGSACIMLYRSRPGAASPQQLGSRTQSLTVFVEDVDAHYERTRSAGARIFEEMNETIYGERQYGVEDLEGHRWLFSQHVRDVSPDEWGAKLARSYTHITAVDGSPLAPESIRMMEYLDTRAKTMNTAAIRERIRAAARECENAAAMFSSSDARRHPITGKWCAADVVDHIAQTQIRGTEELRNLLAGRRPPGPPVYEALRSGAAQWAPWELLVEELREANRAMIDLFENVSDEPPSANAPTVRTVMVTLRKLDDGSTAPQIFFVELGWKEYALLQRLHLLDHRTQLKNLHTALNSPVE